MDRAPETPPSASLPFAAGCLTFVPRWEETGRRQLSGQPRITHLRKRSDLARLLRMVEQEYGRPAARSEGV